MDALDSLGCGGCRYTDVSSAYCQRKPREATVAIATCGLVVDSLENVLLKREPESRLSLAALSEADFFRGLLQVYSGRAPFGVGDRADDF